MTSESQGAAVPTVAIKVGGSDMPHAAVADLLRVTVEESVDRPSSFALELANIDMNTQRITWSDESLFDAGSVVEVRFGHDGNQETVVVGEITGLEISISSRARCLLTVHGHDRLHRFRRGRRTRSYVQAKDSDVAQQIARDLGLTPDAEDSGEVHPYLLQTNQTDIDFLLSRARAIGYELWVDDRTLHFRKVPNDRGEALTLSLSRGLLAFVAYLSTMDQVSGVAVHGWDPGTKQELVGRAGPADVAGTMNGGTVGPAAVDRLFGGRVLTLVEHPVATQNEADLLAHGVLNEIALSYVRARATAVGDATIRVGTVIKFDDLGRRFNGRYYVTHVTHAWDGQYLTHLQVRRNAS